MSAHAYAETQLVELPVIGLFAELGWQTMVAMEEASISFQLMVEVRNKLLESYQELMRMQV